jgi:hypothetical protein
MKAGKEKGEGAPFYFGLIRILLGTQTGKEKPHRTLGEIYELVGCGFRHG